MELLPKARVEDEELYSGPAFEELDADLQEAFGEYLAETAGVNENTAAFIAMYSDFKEQQEYTAWLDGVEKFIK